jgi:TolB-like protein/Flp pilus assembly protein TadD
VSEFVEALKTELESTFKDEVSVYFDINPHDGLLETHDVDASLKEKLKCAVFIPIISRTYCDPKSFAWVHEFKAFIEEASKDQYGLKIKLPGGNIANRVLPVQIHDLDPEDRKLIESELGGHLRGIEFIYKEPGVNRPLTPKDSEDKNLNKAVYRNQINKVANAIKDIISGLSNPGSDEKTKPANIKLTENRKKGLKIITGTLIILALITAGYFIVTRIFKTDEQPEKSLAVLPFINDSPDEENAYFINGIMDEVLNNLQKIKDFRVLSRTSSEHYRGKDIQNIPKIARDLGVNYIVEGSGKKYGDKFRLSVRLIAAKNEKLLWNETYEQETKSPEDNFRIQIQVAVAIANELEAIITPEERNLIEQKSTNNSAAYDYYLQGRQYDSELKYLKAIEMYSKAIEQDSNYVNALLARSYIYSRIFFTRGTEYNNYTGDWKGFDKLAKADLEKAIKISPNLPDVKLVQADQLYTMDRNYKKAISILEEIEPHMSNNPAYYNLQGAIFRRMGRWEESLQAWNKQILLDPLNAAGYIEAAHTYRLLRRYPEAVEFFNKSKLINPNPENKSGIFSTIILWKGDVDEALRSAGIDLSEINVSVISYYYYKRQFENILINAGRYEDQFAYRPRTLNLSNAYYLTGNNAKCRQFADSAITELNRKVKESPGDDRYYEALGYAFAFKGAYDKAFENIREGIRLKPLKMDAWQGYDNEISLMQIYIIAGELDLAMDKMEYLLSIPGELSVNLLKVDPIYDRLRNLPRFKKILETDYKTKY